MEQVERDALAVAWLEYQATYNEQEDGTEASGLWAFAALADLAQDDPESTWLIVLDLLGRTEDEHLLGMIGTCPLEDLVHWNGELVIDRIEQTAAANAHLRYALSYVWAFDSPVRQRLNALMDALGEPRTR